MGESFLPKNGAIFVKINLIFLSGSTGASGLNSLRVFHGKPNAAQHPHRMGQVEMNG
jgi:hypothetical protein